MNSEIQLYTEAHQLIMVVDGVRISLNIQAAEQLHDALGQILPQLSAEHVQAQSEKSKLSALIDVVQSEWNDCFEAQLQLACDILATGQSQKAFELLAVIAGPEMAWVGWCQPLVLQPDGWVALKPQYAPELLIGLSELAVQAPHGSALSMLWSQHAWDMALLRAMEQTPPENLPECLHDRILSIVQQRQEFSGRRFLMGAEGEDAWPFEGPIHEVTLSQSIELMRFPVSQILYYTVMGHNPALHVGASRPVEQVSWVEACRFCNALSKKEGLESVYVIDADSTVHWDLSKRGYRLPTEAEWECAAQGGASVLYAGSQVPAEVAWFVDNANGQSHAIGQKKPNGYGLYDICGNVWEWCWDGYDAEFYLHEAASWDPVGSLHCSEHVCRGGSYLDTAHSLRVSLRGRFDLSTSWSALGFRLVLQNPYVHWEQKENTAVTLEEETP